MKKILAAALCAALAPAAVAGPPHRHATDGSYAVRVLDSSVQVKDLPDSGPSALAIIEITDKNIVKHQFAFVTGCGETAGRFVRLDIDTRKAVADDAYFLEGSRILDKVAYEICMLGADWIDGHPGWRRPAAAQKGKF